MYAIKPPNIDPKILDDSAVSKDISFNSLEKARPEKNTGKVSIIGNIIFIIITKIFTRTFFSDPGQSSYIFKRSILKKFKNLKINNISLISRIYL